MIMASAHEMFWTRSTYAFVGHSAKKGFPRISYGELKKGGKKAFAVDPSVDQIDGDKTYPDLRSLPEKVDGVVIEVPREETLDWVRQAADAGIKNVWVHMNRDTPEALALAKEKGLNIVTGTCAVMYVTQSPSYHSIHKWLNKLLGKY
jgi:predicted CoA-binding protein